MVQELYFLMAQRIAWARLLPRILWVCALIAIVAWALQPGYVVGWDLNVYRDAMRSLLAGHDPYADAMAIQRIYHAQGPHPPGTAVPFSYVYSPMTLGLVRLAGRMPVAVVGTIYWLVYAAAVMATLAVGWWMVEKPERRVFALLVPAAVFFPGLLQQDVLFSGNVAFILYGLVLTGAWLGWRRGVWWPFYVAVVAASCFKAPLLSLVVIAPLSARGQWVKATAAAAVGVALFAVQPHVWPSLFRNYLMAVELQFDYNRDFSSSPAGLAANAFFNRAPYKVVSVVAYALYGLPVFAVMVKLGNRVKAGALRLREWAPVLVVGTVLLNPRIMEYDVAPLAVPMALVLWRFFRRVSGGSAKWAGVGLGIVFALVNTVAAHPFMETTWRPTEGVLLLATFAAGAWTLSRPPLAEGAREAAPAQTVALRS